MTLQEYSIFLICSQLWVAVVAEFRNKFENTTRGSDLLLQWDPVDSNDYPLTICCRLINQTSDYGANLLEVNIISKESHFAFAYKSSISHIVPDGLNASSFPWKSVPYPLPYLETAKYEVEIRPQNWVGPKSSVAAFASSPYFTISDLEGDVNTDSSGAPFDGTTIIPSKPTNQPSSNARVSNNTAIAAGLVVPVVVILAVFGFVSMQQRQKRILEEKRKQREELYID
ncbi:hypothetical protein F5Y06DRAFT_296238 [Hypoxylon sp. FL0890]|nr:hypothetical protein F5Y06DRAFT_296238 [Hypoxylon sp. FL0890]